MGVHISMVLFHPHGERQLYSKAYLHSDEGPFFQSGQNSATFIDGTPSCLINLLRNICPCTCGRCFPKRGRSICSERSEICERNRKRLIKGCLRFARRYSMPVLMSNCVGRADNSECAGLTSVWNSRGVLVAQLDAKNEGLLIFDTDTQEVIKRQVRVGNCLNSSSRPS